MYYISPLTGPCPAQAPTISRQDEKYEWGYGQRRHNEALKDMRSFVDQSKPKSINPNARAVQKRTRNFVEDQRRAEIGRENRKLVERLASISKGYGGNDPSGPPRISTTSKANDSTSGSGVDGGMSASQSKSATQACFSEAARKMKQRMLDQENAALVRRILATGSTFDRKAEARSFSRHKRNVSLLQRLPAEAPLSPNRKRGPGSLPPLRHARPLSVPSVPLRGLEELFVPGDLRKSGSGPLTTGYGGGILFASQGGLGTSASTTAPLRNRGRDDDEASDYGAQDRPSSNRSGGRGGSPGRLPRDAGPPTLGKIEGLRGDSKFEPQRDEETERRQWLTEQERLEETLREAPASSEGGGGADMHRNMSNSELQYAEDEWDDGSFSGTPKGGTPKGGGASFSR